MMRGGTSPVCVLLKSYNSFAIGNGKFWQRDYFDNRISELIYVHGG